MNEETGHIEYIDLISQSLSGDISAENQVKLDAWLAEDPANQSTYHEFKIALDFSDIPAPMFNLNVEDEWKTFQSKLSSSTTEQKEEPKVIAFEPESEEKSSGGFNIMKIAAAVVLLIGIAGVFLLQQTAPTQYEAYADIVEKELPDGSHISLNRKAILEYEDDFNKKVRKVKLVKGEAHFEVEHNPEKPFIVESGEIIVTVLGTDFVVSNYLEDNEVEVFVKSGKVSVTYTSTGKEVILTAGEKASFSREEKTLEEEVIEEDANFLSWKTKKFKFRNKSMKRIINKLNRAYGTDIQIKTKKLKKEKVSTQFEDQDIEEIIEVLEATVGAKATKKGNKIILE